MYALQPQPTPEQLTANRDTTSGPSSAAPNSNFWNRCAWSADGACLLASQDDGIMQVLAQPCEEASPSASPALLATIAAVPQTEAVYDAALYPGFNAAEPQTACFAVSCRGQPVHLWDAFTGSHRAVYRTYDHADEVATAHSLCFHPDGERCGCPHTVNSTHSCAPVCSTSFLHRQCTYP